MLPSFFPLDVCQPMYQQFYEPLTNITTNKLIEIHLQKLKGTQVMLRFLLNTDINREKYVPHPQNFSLFAYPFLRKLHVIPPKMNFQA